MLPTAAEDWAEYGKDVPALPCHPASANPCCYAPEAPSNPLNFCKNTQAKSGEASLVGSEMRGNSRAAQSYTQLLETWLGMAMIFH